MTNATAPIAEHAQVSRPLGVSLWLTQALLSLVFVGTGVWKLLTPIPKLAAMIPWAGQVPEGFLQATAIIDLCGGLGILLPALTRTKPSLTPLAALGCAALQVCAIVFHVSRGETVMDNHKLVGKGGHGKYLWRRIGQPPIPGKTK